ncbi:MAG: hypothetical protein IT342_03885 [Candidatus Melainabacteria bacterium]|nr:hypothetical protein [Candidatus Melainabacteria bacterium]
MKTEKHSCHNSGGIGWANTEAKCLESEDGRLLLLVREEEYSFFANFCPFCGAKAPVQLDFSPPESV